MRNYTVKWWVYKNLWSFTYLCAFVKMIACNTPGLKRLNKNYSIVRSSRSSSAGHEREKERIFTFLRWKRVRSTEMSEAKGRVAFFVKQYFYRRQSHNLSYWSKLSTKRPVSFHLSEYTRSSRMTWYWAPEGPVSFCLWKSSLTLCKMEQWAGLS